MRVTLAPELPPAQTVTQQAVTEKVVTQLPTLTDLFASFEPETLDSAECSEGAMSAQLQNLWPQNLWPQTLWRIAIATMGQMLSTSHPAEPASRLQTFEQNVEAAQVCTQQGIIFCSPVPVFSDLAILAHFRTWVFTPKGRSDVCQLPPASASHPFEVLLPTIPILTEDALTHEQFCLIQTPQFCWIAILGRSSDGTQQFNFSFDPATVEHIWMALQLRVPWLQQGDEATLIAQWRSRFLVTAPDYRIPMRFGQALLRQAHLVSPPAPPDRSRRVQSPTQRQQQINDAAIGTALNEQTLSKQTLGGQIHSHIRPELDRDVELLKVLAHEVRTPLTTIQTLTRLLLRRSDLPSDVIKRLEAIQRECCSQIDRFGLIFRAMELTQNECQHLETRVTPIALQALLADNLVRWQNHAARRGLTLQVTIPKRLPRAAIRDPHLLDQVLTGLIEYLSYCLCEGSHIHLKASLAGAQLKIQLQTQSDQQSNIGAESPMLRAVGQLLMFQPETGGISLSLSATKHLFQALGGKLTVRKYLQGEVLTVFLPLGTDSEAY